MRGSVGTGSDRRSEVDRSLFRTSDPDQSRAYLASMYGTGMRMGRPSERRATFRHEREPRAACAWSGWPCP
ncbi:hypothetical protein GCM10010521_01700 [Streptomyces rameus]|uniref:Uncharacterized protein n=1 Tax=Streptomyces rameus TaxID=68261 RepID=A0ABP6MKP2_9ACTN